MDVDYVLYVVQIPSQSAEVDPLKNLERFNSEMPVLALLGSPVPIEHTSKFSIAAEVQLVCKYLKAYETKKINKLYRERKWLVTSDKKLKLLLS